MLFGSQSTQKTLFDLFSTDATLTTLLGAGKIFDHVPDNQPFPFVVIGDGVWENRDHETLDGMECAVTIHVWYRAPGRGRLKVQEIQKRIDDLLHKTEPCIEDWNIVSLSRGTIEILVEPDNVTLHGIQTFNLMIGES